MKDEKEMRERFNTAADLQGSYSGFFPDSVKDPVGGGVYRRR
jgi:hypothetical protein